MSSDSGRGGEGICLGCGAVVDQIAPSGACGGCGQPVMRREARFRLGLGTLEAEPAPTPQARPPEVEEAARQPENLFAEKYVLVQRIGGGGMGWVWKAWEDPLARYVAIKFLRVPSGEDILRFEREARLAAALSHPNIVPIYEFGRSKGEYYLVMKLIDGPSLDAAGLGGADLVKAMIPVCRAVDHAHKAGVIHRDLKPQNVMLTSEGWPYVLDFGLAKNVDAGKELSQSGMAVGTPPYMSPEQAQGRRDLIDRRSDVYALGATLYALVTGRPPFEGATPMEVLLKVIKEEVTPPRHVKAETPPMLEAIILKALEKDPARRYATASDLAEDLRRLSTGETVVARPPRRRLVPRLVRQNPGVAASLGVAVAAIGVALALFAARPSGGAAPPPPNPIDGSRGEWLREFSQARMEFRVGERPDETRTSALLALMKKAPAVLGRDTGDLVQWFREQAALGGERVRSLEERGRAVWPEKRDEAERLAAWALGLQALLEAGLPEEAATTGATFRDLSSRATRIARFRGLATLRVHVFPSARLQSMKAGERWFIREGAVLDRTMGTPLEEDLSCPVVLRALEIEDYEVELVHPDLGTRTMSIRKDQMEHGKEYWLRGSMAAGGTLRLSSEP